MFRLRATPLLAGTEGLGPSTLPTARQGHASRRPAS